ncbi:hypothetical protein [Streptomyces sp. NBC_00343]|uniref:hypothetical protein n=1 Tax=Streptomyces sp. NBC_00343 TaxID=2975719 RepID=UPI002E2CAF62|nr:hypothetical protein [Streptomyces sp. NBC_00343]
MAKVCVFCGGTPLTKEHVLPRWLKVALDPTVRRHRYIRLSNGTVRQHDSTPLDAQVKIVCSECNSGWMNQLEENVRQFLPDLIRGNACTLDPEAQRALASWSVKTMLMLQYTHPAEVRVIPVSDLTRFHEVREPTSSMLGRMGFMNYPPDDSVPLVDTLCQGYGISGADDMAWISTLKIGCMVVQVLRAPKLAEGHILAPFSASSVLRPVWPPHDTIEWPLRAAIPYESMMDLAHPEVLNMPIVPL